MRRKPKVLMADSVRAKRRKWQQINITAFAKKMEAIFTLNAEVCCDTLHQDLRRNGTEVRKHPKRVLRSFTYYTLYLFGIRYNDKLGAGILLHDVAEDVSRKLLSEIRIKYGVQTYQYINAVSRRINESIKTFVKRATQTDSTLLMRLCDAIDNGLDMLDEHYAGLDSAPFERVKEYFNTKIQSLLEAAEKNNFLGSEYERSIREALGDLKLIYKEAQDFLAMSEPKKQ